MNNANTTIVINNHPNTTPVIVDTAFFDLRGKAYVFPCADGDGFMCYSGDDGAFLCWIAELSHASLDASIAEGERIKKN